MKLPPPEVLPSLFDSLGVPATAPDAQLVSRACSLFAQTESGSRAATITDKAEFQAAEAWLIANGLWTPVLRWPYQKLHDLVGEVLPGDVVVVAAATGNGKSTFVANVLEDIRHRPGTGGVTVFPLETAAGVFRLKIACLHLGYPIPAVFRQRWGTGEGRVGVSEVVGRTALRREIARMMQGGERERLRYVDTHRLDAKALIGHMRHAADWQHRLIIVDHLHHMQHARGPEGIRETMQQVKEAAAGFGMGVVFLAQIGRADKRDQRRPFYPPALTDVQGSSAIEQVADLTVLLYRPLLDTVKVADLDDVIMGHRAWRSVFKPQTMGMLCAKSRLDGESARGERIELAFHGGRLSDWGPEPVPMASGPEIGAETGAGEAGDPLDEGAAYGPND